MPAISEEALEKAALHYLERFAASTEQLRKVLRRRIKRATMLGAEEEATAAAKRVIERLLLRYVAAGLLDDRRFAAAQTHSLRRRGTSRQGIRQRLAAKGVERELVEAALAEDGDAASELAAAGALARRRRLGPYRQAAARDAFRKRDLATLARAGFPLEVARRILAAEDPEALERLIDGERSESP
jgi:regulatory protein